jgi:hypothetical protein
MACERLRRAHCTKLGQCLQEWLVGDQSVWVTAALQSHRVGNAYQLPRQTTLADAGLTGDQHHLPFALDRLAPAVNE